MTPERAARLARIEAEVGPTAASLRRARLADVELDLMIDRLRARRRAGRRNP